MKYKFLLITATLIILILFISCTDNISKSEDIEIFPRVEFSKCTACYECIDKFQCPQNAIIKDERHNTVYIDEEKCIRCLECINVFDCEFNAFTFVPDTIPPAGLRDFSAVSDSIGCLKIEFIAPGDDSLSNYAYEYDFLLTDTSGELIEIDFVSPLPLPSGYTENWFLTGLPEKETVNLSIRAFDEAGNKSLSSTASVEILGEYVDEEAPLSITDLQTINEEYTIELRWTAPVDPEPRSAVESYIIKYSNKVITENNWNEAEEIENDLQPSPPGSEENFVIYYNNPSGDVFFVIRSTDIAGNISDISNNAIGNATGDITAPAQITDLSAGEPGFSSLPLTWTAPGDNNMLGEADGYELKISDTEINEANWNNAENYTCNLTPLPAGSIETFMVSGLTSQTEYFFAIKAFDEVGNSSPVSNSASGTTTSAPDTLAPAQVTDLSANVSDTLIILTWTASGDNGNSGTASSYDIRYFTAEIDDTNWDTAFTLNNIPLPAPAGSAESISIDYLEHGVNWFFAIICLDEENNSSAISNNAQAMIPLDEIPPAAVTDLFAEVIEEDIILTWTAPGDDGNSGTCSSYDLRWLNEEITLLNWETANQLETAFPQEAGSPETVTVTGLEADITHFFALTASDENDNTSDISNNCEAIIEIEIDEIPPATVTDLSITAGEYSVVNRITINWTAPGDDGNTGQCSIYDLRYSESPITEQNWDEATIFGSPPFPGLPGSSETVTVTGLEAGIIYYFAIKGIDEAGNLGEISNSPGGKSCYQILSGPCRDCNNCINDCDQNAIYDAGPYKAINPDLCIGCGDCSCPWGYIRPWVITY